MPYDLGSVAVLEYQAKDVSGVPAAATTIALSVTTPDGTPHALTPTAGLPPDQTGPATGWYYCFYTTTQSGRHTVSWTAAGVPGVGVGVGAQTDSWDVRSATDDMIISLSDMKRRLRLDTSDTSYDQDVREFGLAVTGVVEKLAGEVVVKTVTAERQRAGGMFVALNRRPVYQPATQPYQIIAMAPVLTYGLVYDLSLLTVDMDLGIVRHSAGLPFIYGPYDFTYTVGRPMVPDNIILATAIILKHLWGIERAGGPKGLNAPDDDVTMAYGFAIPNRAMEILEATGTRETGGIA